MKAARLTAGRFQLGRSAQRLTAQAGAVRLSALAKLFLNNLFIRLVRAYPLFKDLTKGRQVFLFDDWTAGLSRFKGIESIF